MYILNCKNHTKQTIIEDEGKVQFPEIDTSKKL